MRECVPNEKTNGKGNYALFSLIYFSPLFVNDKNRRECEIGGYEYLMMEPHCLWLHLESQNYNAVRECVWHIFMLVS